MAKIINIFGAPNSGKSTLAANLFGRMKKGGYKVELVTEFPKELLSQGRGEALADQAYVFGNQHHKQWVLLDKVDYVITDSPILLSAVYCTSNHFHTDSFQTMVRETFRRFNNVSFLLPPSPWGYDNSLRMHIDEECNLIHRQITAELEQMGYEKLSVDGDYADQVVQHLGLTC